MSALLALMLAAAPAAAQQPAAETAPASSSAAVAVPAAAAAPALPEKHEQQIRALLLNLELLLQHGPQGRPDKLDTLAAELGKLDDKVREALGRPLLERLAAKARADREAALTQTARSQLQELRFKLRGYFAAKGGVYPASPVELAEQLPALQLPAHGKPGALRLIDSKKYDNQPENAVEDQGGWLYFSNPASANFGMLLLDCDHKDAAGVEFYKY